MKRTSLVVTILVLMSLLFVGMRFLPEARATTLYVGGAGPGNYTTIQSAIDNASSGETIYVYEGTYHENVIINHSVSLIGEDENRTIIEGVVNSPAIMVWADWVNISGFTLVNSGEYPWMNPGIELQFARNCYITNINATSGHADGIHIRSSVAITISNTRIVNDGIFILGTTLEAWNTHTIDTSNTVNGRPVYYWKNVTGGKVPPGAGKVILANTSGVIVENQNIGNVTSGIEIGFSSGNIIANNTALNNIGEGILMISAENNTIVNNTIRSTYSNGMLISSSKSNLFDGNNLSLNEGDGINYVRSDGDVFVRNTIFSNEDRGIYVSGSTNSTFADNVLLRNWDNLYIQSSSNLTIANNTLRQHGGCGICLQY